MSDNPFQSSADTADSKQPTSPSISTHRATYNVVSDTVTGINVRWSDNRLQAIIVFISVIVLSIVGAVFAILNADWNLPWYGGVLIGSFAGLVIGIFASGIFLMVYRAARHIRGEHD